MTCNDERCLPPTDVPFSIDAATLAVLVGDAAGEGAAGSPPVSFLHLTRPAGGAGVIFGVRSRHQKQKKDYKDQYSSCSQD